VSAENGRVVRRIFEEYVNAQRTDLLNELVADECVGMQSGSQAMGRAAFAATLEALRRGFPDIRYSLEELPAEGDFVAVRWQWTGTHRALWPAATTVQLPSSPAI
jgi:predicted ester cyclase